MIGERPVPNSSLVATGVATGILAGLLGVGGGIILVPALVTLGFSRHRAAATSLAAILIVAVTGAVTFGIAGEIDLPTGVALGLGGLVGSTVGAGWMNRLSARTLAVIFGVLLLGVGTRMLLPVKMEAAIANPELVLGLAVGFVIGIVSGIVSGLAGVGGGIIMVPAMVLLLGISQHTAEGTSLLAIVFTAAAGTRVNARNGHVDWRAMGILGLTGAVFAPAAALLAQRIPAETLTRIFGAFVILTALRTLWGARTRPATRAGA
jgi:hypothetical protein